MPDWGGWVDAGSGGARVANPVAMQAAGKNNIVRKNIVFFGGFAL
jgi:hypothetical protein